MLCERSLNCEERQCSHKYGFVDTVVHVVGLFLQLVTNQIRIPFFHNT
jgi:hypothetical protein